MPLNRATRSFTSFRRLSEYGQDERNIGDDFGGRDAPKLKFNFTMTLGFRRNREEGLNDYTARGGNTGSDDFRFMTFALKQASRPNPSITYQDINFYNYRTKVATRMDYGTMNLTFYDDSNNNAHYFYEYYLKSVSPIANLEKKYAGNLEERGPENVYEFNKEIGEGAPLPGSASIGPLPEGQGRYGVLEFIILHHYYWRRPPGATDASDPTPFIQRVDYEFLNPKIVNMTLDELDMTQSDSSSVMLVFNYDSAFIRAPVPVEVIDEPIQGDDEVPASDFRTFSRIARDVASNVADVRRAVNKVRRLDTIPDIGLSSGVIFVPPTSGIPSDIEVLAPSTQSIEDFLGTVGILQGGAEAGE